MNRKQLQRNADREKRLTQLQRELEKRDRRRKLENGISSLLLLVFVVLAGIFASQVTPVQLDGGTSSDPSSISFTESHIDWMQENYNESMENGFCLFGHIRDDRVVVEQVEFVDNPPHQGPNSMSFTCLPQILARSGDLVTQEDYVLVGAIHTHPNYAELSRRDRETFRTFAPVLGVFGVYNGNQLTMYSKPDQQEALTNILQVG